MGDINSIICYRWRKRLSLGMWSMLTRLWTVAVICCFMELAGKTKGIILNVEETVNASAGEPVTIPCSYTDGKDGVNVGENTVIWIRLFPNGSMSESLVRKSGPDVTGSWVRSSRATVVDQASLRIFSVSVREAGKYTCMVGEKSGTTSLFVDERPRIEPDLSELILNTTDRLELSCIGTDKLSWSWPDHDEIYRTVTAHKSLVSQMLVLTIERVSPADTGEYQCRSTSSDGEMPMSRSLYVFVTSEDGAIFLPTEQTLITKFWDEPFVIPCRVYNPSVIVSLVPIVNVTAEEVTYDPRVGFTVEAESSQYNGNVSCLAAYGDRTDILSFNIAIADRPDLTLASPELTISENQVLELNCVGIRAIVWTYKNGQEDRVRIESTESHSPSERVVYRSILRLENTDWMDTGEYACKYKYYQESDDPRLVAGVYVFVQSDDRKRLFLQAESKIIFIQEEKQPFIIPCRVSDPSAADTVRITALYTKTGKPVVQFNETWERVYDPKVGFLVSPRRDINMHSVISLRKVTLYCKNSSEQLQFFQLHQEGMLDNFFQGEMDPMEERLIQGERSFTVTCSITLSYLAYPEWTLDVRPSIKLMFPKQEADPDNFDLGNLQTNYLLSNIVYNRTATIHNVSKEHSGVYSCNIYNVESSVTLTGNLTVLESGFVQLSPRAPEIEVVEAVRGQETLCLSITAESFPAANHWWSKDGVDLAGETSQWFWSVEQPVPAGRVDILGCIGNVSDVDDGFYTVSVANEYEMKNHTFRLVVLAIPEVNLTVSPSPIFADPTLYYIEQVYELTCLAWGNPVPNVSLCWAPCRDLLCSVLPTVAATDGGDWEKVDGKMDGKIGMSSVTSDEVISDRMVRTVLSVKPSMSGVFRCLATSPSAMIQEMAHDSLEYRLADYEIVLPAPRVVRNVYTSDPVSINCTANIYAFEKQLVWLWTPVAGSNASDRIPDSRVPAEVNRWKHHYVSVLRFGASLNDSGIYRCWVNQSTTQEKLVITEVQLNVKDIVPPSITVGLHPSYNLDKNNPKSLKPQLECQAVGDPTPTVKWFKDYDLITAEGDITTTTMNNIVTSQLTVTLSQSEVDGGTYSCHAENNGGSLKSQGRIFIQASPTARIKPDKLKKMLGENLTITCETDGKPPPNITWQRKKPRVPYTSAVDERMYDNSGRKLVFGGLTAEDAGKYVCTAINQHGAHSAEVSLDVVLEESGGNFLKMVLTTIGVISGIVFLLLIVCITFMAKRLFRLARKAKRNQDFEMVPVSSRSLRSPLSPFRMSFKEEFSDQMPFDAKWEFPRDRLKLGALIGQGAFGMVHKGVAAGINKQERYVPVAVKTVKADASHSDRKALLGELKMLIQVGHHLNVVNFLGACTQDHSPLIIVEFCPFGNLLDFLRSKRDTFQPKASPFVEDVKEDKELNYLDLALKEVCVSEPPAVEYEMMENEAKRVSEQHLRVEDLVCYCFQVARGMEFLASRKCIHRDLAARNVLLAENNVVKICDFGLSRSFYHEADYIGSGKGLLPIKWMAPEAIFDKVFTTYSDIWSFGVFTWEVFSLGGSPYPGVQVDEKFYDKMKMGYRMSCPDHCPREVYQLMLECWRVEPKERPMFSEQAGKFGEQLECNTRQEYIDLNIPYQEGLYLEADFGIKPETVVEETKQSVASDMDASTDPLYHREGAGKMVEAHAEENRYASLKRQNAADKDNHVQSNNILQTDPDRRTDNVSQDKEDVIGREAGGEDTQEDALRNHLYSSIKMAHGHRLGGTAGAAVRGDPSEKNHTYSSIRGLRPGRGRDPKTSDPAPDPAGQEVAGAQPTEACSLLGGLPKLPERDCSPSGSLSGSPSGSPWPTLRGSPRTRPRAPKPPLPDRDVPTKISPVPDEVETLLVQNELYQSGVSRLPADDEFLNV